MTKRNFKPYNPDQLNFLPPNPQDWLPENHMVNFILEVVNELNLDSIINNYNSARGGQPGYHPKMMVALLLYGYCNGITSSRKLEKATYEQVPFRVLTTSQHPDHDTISSFRQRHLKALGDIFLQSLCLCQKAGLVKLGHVCLDGSKVKANASKRKAMSYGNMQGKINELESEIKSLMDEAALADNAEDAKYGKGVQADEVPKELAFRKKRIQKIKEAKLALEEEAKKRGQKKEPPALGEKEKDDNNEPKHPSNQQDSDKPNDKQQRNFTDPDSRIMKSGGSQSFEQAYNAQICVDSKAQVIVAAEVTQSPTDINQTIPMVQKMKENLGALPKIFSADAGYFSKDNADFIDKEKMDSYISPGRDKKDMQKNKTEALTKAAKARKKMRKKINSEKGRGIYKYRKAIVEPVFGQIKECRGIRSFLMRGFGKIQDEWKFICATHNLLKLFRYA